MIIVASSVLPLDRIRWIGAATCLGLILANLFSSQCSGLSDLIVTRVFAGLGSGILVWITTSVIVRVAKPEQTAGAFLAVQTLAQAVLAALLALLVIPFGGWAWGFVAIALCLLLSGLFITRLPAKMLPLLDHASSQPPLTPGVITASLIGCFSDGLHR